MIIREKHQFLYHGQSFFAKDITLHQFLMLNTDPQQGYEEIIKECNEVMPTLNQRQKREFLRILVGGDQEPQKLIDKISPTEKKIREYKEKSKKKLEKSQQDFLKDWHIIEGQMMQVLHQPLIEMRSWPYKYFMDLYKDLPIITGAKEYDKHRNSKKPDKSGFKKEFGDKFAK